MNIRSQPRKTPDAAEDRTATLLEALRDGISANDTAALIDVGRDGVTRSTLYADIWQRAHGVSENFATGGPIVAVFDDPADMICAFWATLLAGRPILMIQAHALTGARTQLESKLRRAVDLLGDPLVLTTQAIWDRLSHAVSASTKSIVIDDLPASPSRPAQTARRKNKSGAVRADLVEQFELLVWTSGTTSTPKIARISAPALCTRVLASRRNGRAKVTINGFPFDGVSGSSIAFPNGNDVIYLRPDRFAEDPTELLRLIEAYRVASIGFSSSSAWRCLEALNGCNFDLSSLRHVGFGSERIIPGVVERLFDRLAEMGAKELDCRLGYGMTEMGLICSSEAQSPAEVLAALNQSTPHAVVGPPLPGLSLRIRQQGGAIAGPGVEGEIEVHGPGKMFSGYLGVPEDDQPFTTDGWLVTGDRGYLQGDGLRLTGRSRQDIVVNGRNHSLAAIEAALGRLEGIDPIRLAALCVMPMDATTEELAVFFSLPPGADHEKTAAEIRRVTMRTFGVPARHVIAVTPEAFPLTPSGKVDRSTLSSGFAEQRWPALIAKAAAEAPVMPDNELGDRIAILWMEVLDLDEKPRPHDDFYALGGDSFAAASVILGAEAITNRLLNVEDFFVEPTVATMVRLLGETSSAPQRDTGEDRNAPELLHSLARYVGGWKGDRALPDSLIVGRNLAGTRSPILWVLQSEHEMQDLAEALGPDQPIYAMRSGVKIVQRYSTGVIETLVNRYLWEILSLPLSGPFVLGGNCQGAIIALALARRLRQLGRPLRKLILLEWAFSDGRYDGPTLLMYGERSPLAEHYTAESDRVTWRADFPGVVPVPLPAGHGGFFRPDCLPHFARLLLAETE